MAVRDRKTVLTSNVSILFSYNLSRKKKIGVFFQSFPGALVKVPTEQ